MKNLTFQECMELLKTKDEFDAKLILNAGYSRKTIRRYGKKLDIFNHIDDTYETMNEKQFNQWYGNSLYLE